MMYWKMPPLMFIFDLKRSSDIRSSRKIQLCALQFKEKGIILFLTDMNCWLFGDFTVFRVEKFINQRRNEISQMHMDSLVSKEMHGTPGWHPVNDSGFRRHGWVQIIVNGVIEVNWVGKKMSSPELFALGSLCYHTWYRLILISIHFDNIS